MTVRRRSAFLSLAFLGAATFLATPPAARGQERRIPGLGGGLIGPAAQDASITPEQVRDVLHKLGADVPGGPDLADLIRRVQQENPGLDRKLVESITRDGVILNWQGARLRIDMR